MKREILRLMVLSAIGTTLVGGCYTRHYEPVVSTAATGEVIVTEAPPAPRREVVGVAPSSEDVWVQGYWAYRHGRYVWVRGHWERRPRVAAVYVPGRWDHTARGYVWVPGRWD